MTAAELYKQGQLQAAIEAITAEVKARPADDKARVFLAELLAFAGQLDRAITQLDAFSYQDVQQDVARQLYKKLFTAMKQRDAFFATGQPAPKLNGPPSAHVQKRLAAALLTARGELAAASAELDAARGDTPALTGTCNGQPFAEFADTDDLFSGILELIAQDTYFWVPFEQIAKIKVSIPETPRDRYLIPAEVELHAGQVLSVFLPVLYPGSQAAHQDALKLGTLTEWHEQAGGAQRALGQHTFTLGETDIGLLELREVIFTPPQPPAAHGTE